MTTKPHSWSERPIASPRFSPRVSGGPQGLEGLSLSPRETSNLAAWAGTSRPMQLRQLYYGSVMAQTGEASKMKAWDSYVAKQNSRAGALPHACEHVAAGS